MAAVTTEPRWGETVGWVAGPLSIGIVVDADGRHEDVLDKQGEQTRVLVTWELCIVLPCT